MASVDSAEKKHSATFSINRHGEEQAKALAIAARNALLEKIDDQFNVYTESADAIARRGYGAAKELTPAQRTTVVDASQKRGHKKSTKKGSQKKGQV